MFLLSLLPFNLLNILRSEIESAPSSNGWDLARLQRAVLKTGARMVTSGRRLWFDLAAAAAPLWERLIARIQRWRWPERWIVPPQPKPREYMPPPPHAHLSPVLRL